MADKKSAAEKLSEKLLYKTKSLYDILSDKEKAEAEKYCNRYKAFLDCSKTERESAQTIREMAEKAGFKEYKGAKLKAGDKFFFVNRDKAIICGIYGSRPIADGINLTAAHIDSPRLDLKIRPLYEDCNLGWLKTHYYGGVRKYQWTATPLALHGVIIKKDGKRVNVCIGEKPDDPVFCITDLLPHLAREQGAQPLNEAIKAENMNALFGSVPYSDAEIKDRVKLNLLKLLNDKYGITEYDFMAADLSLVPVFNARDVGLDRSLIGAYGHDDRVCAFTAATAIFDAKNPEMTCITALVDREEIGSDGVTGMQSDFLFNFIRSLAEKEKADMGIIVQNSRCLSADVAAGLDPNYADVYDKRNSSELNLGPAVIKYTGRSGKADTSEASAEYMAEIRDILDGAKVVWQSGSMGRVDAGGGGTVAKYIAKHNVDTVDIGVPVLSMHSPFEIAAKTDIYMTYKAFKAFYVSKKRFS